MKDIAENIKLKYISKSTFCYIISILQNCSYFPSIREIACQSRWAYRPRISFAVIWELLDNDEKLQRGKRKIKRAEESDIRDKKRDGEEWR